MLNNKKVLVSDSNRSSRTTSCWMFPLYILCLTPNVVIIVGTRAFRVLVTDLKVAILFLRLSE